MAHPIGARHHLGLKFALLVAALFVVALAALVLLQRTQRGSFAELLESETREHSRMMDRVVEMTGQSLRNFTDDYSEWDDMVKFVTAPRRTWAEINIAGSLETFKLAAVWVLRPDGSVVYSTGGENGTESPPFPLDESKRRRVLAAGRTTRFFVQSTDGLLELRCAPIYPSEGADDSDPPRGWLVAARRWDSALLRLIGAVMQCEATLAPPGPAPSNVRPDRITLVHPLPGPDGAPVGSLVYAPDFEELSIVAHDQHVAFALVAGTFALTAILSVHFVFRWIVRPLKIIGGSLEARDVRPILPLCARRDEIGGVAQAVKASFEQQAALEQLMTGRTRLARELHDGVIQTVYAAGMNLTGARAILRQDPAGAERIMEDTRRELNSTITSLRDFIHGLEPEAPDRRSFREALQSVVTLMQGVRPVTATLEIDDALAGALTDVQRQHLLQITREAISNSVRHGQAASILVRLAREAAGAVVEITDDGIGVESATNIDGGRGLANLAARARELGGELQVSSPPGRGLCIRVTIAVAAAGGARVQGDA